MNEQLSFFENDSFYKELKSILFQVETELALPRDSFSIKKNYSQEGKNKGNLISTGIYINEMSYPFDEKNKISKTSVAFYIAPKNDLHEIMLHKNKFPAVNLPTTATIAKQGNEKNLYFHVDFSLNDSFVFQYIHDILVYCIDNYDSSSSFGCCSRYQICSNERKCIHDNKLYAKGCQYRRSLENGKIFY